MAHSLDTQCGGYVDLFFQIFDLIFIFQKVSPDAIAGDLNADTLGFRFQFGGISQFLFAFGGVNFGKFNGIKAHFLGKCDQFDLGVSTA